MQNIKSIIISMIFLVGVTPNTFAQEITTNILTRVFLIKYGNTFGSSFTIEVDDKQYLITAKHVVRGIKNGDNIEIMQNNNWQSLPVKLIEVKPDELDITVLVLPKQLSPTFPIEATSTGLVLAQNMYFLGFPYGLQMEGRTLNSGFPLPLVKQGICSAIINIKDGLTILLLDGFNNTGFSGGPIVFTDQKSRSLKIAGVVSGFRTNIDKVIRPGDKSKGEPEQIDTGNLVLTNSGIVIGHDIDPVIQVIKRNPIGTVVSK